MPGAQTEINRARTFRITTGSVAAAPTDGTTEPHYTMSPRTPTGHRTTGIQWAFEAPASGAASAIAAGFDVTLWISDPNRLRWFSADNQSLGFRELWVTFDINASALYFQIAAASVAGAGNLYVNAWEQ